MACRTSRRSSPGNLSRSAATASGRRASERQGGASRHVDVTREKALHYEGHCISGGQRQQTAKRLGEDARIVVTPKHEESQEQRDVDAAARGQSPDGAGPRGRLGVDQHAHAGAERRRVSGDDERHGAQRAQLWRSIDGLAEGRLALDVDDPRQEDVGGGLTERQQRMDDLALGHTTGVAADRILEEAWERRDEVGGQRPQISLTRGAGGAADDVMAAMSPGLSLTPRNSMQLAATWHDLDCLRREIKSLRMQAVQVIGGEN
jgi:hypothetical protein